jgi:hypothetical protein
MLPEMPFWLSELIEAKNLTGLLEFSQPTKNLALQAWATYGLGECYRNGGPHCAIDKATAVAYFKRALELKPEIYYLNLHAKTGIADCLRVGDQHFSANIKAAYDLYVKLEKNETLPTLLGYRVQCGIADCLRQGDAILSSDFNRALNFLNDLLRKNDLPLQLRARILMGKIDCLMRCVPKIPFNIKLTFDAIIQFEQIPANHVPDNYRPWVLFTKMICLKRGDTDLAVDLKQAKEIAHALRQLPNLPLRLVERLNASLRQGGVRQKKRTALEMEPFPPAQTFASPLLTNNPLPTLQIAREENHSAEQDSAYSFGLLQYESPEIKKPRRKLIESSPECSPRLT